MLIATSTPTHADLIELAARTGKAILCEKPIDLDLGRVRKCRDAIAGCDGLKGVAFVDAVVDCHEAAEPRWIKPAYV